MQASSSTKHIQTLAIRATLAERLFVLGWTIVSNGRHTHTGNFTQTHALRARINWMGKQTRTVYSVVFFLYFCSQTGVKQQIFLESWIARRGKSSIVTWNYGMIIGEKNGITLQYIWMWIAVLIFRSLNTWRPNNNNEKKTM